MKTVFTERNLLIVVGVALAVIYWNHQQKKEARLARATASVVRPASTPLGQSKQTPPDVATVATTPAPSAKTQQPSTSVVSPSKSSTSSQSVGNLDLCRNFSSHKLLVHKKLLKPVLTLTNAALAIPEDLQSCLSQNATVLVLNFAGFDYKNPEPYFYSSIEPRAFLSTIEKDLTLNSILANSTKLHQLGFTTEASASKFYAEIFGPNSLKKKWSYVPFSISDKSLGTATFFPPENHPLAKTVKKENINRLISSGGVVLDVRPSKHYKQSHIENAISSPTSIKKIAQAALSVEEQKKAGYVIHPGTLPKDKNTAVIVVNQNPKSFSAYNTITHLASFGYTNLHFYWGGMDDWEGKSIVLPEKAEGVRFITYNELKARFTSPDALVVDVRSSKNTKKKILPRNINMPFSEKKNAFKDPLYRMDGITASSIQQHGERFTVGMPDLPSNINTLVLVGDHSFDWKPVKAAMVIPHGSSIKIEIYRDGYKGWKYLSGLESPLPKRIGLSKKDLPRTGNSSARTLTSGIVQNPVSSTNNLAKNDVAQKDSKDKKDSGEQKGKKKDKKSKAVRTTRSDGTPYQRLNAPSPVKPK